MYFEKVRSARDVKIEDVQELFENPGSITTRVVHNPKEAEKIRLKFERYFGC